MAKERENMFAMAAAKRKTEQSSIEASLLNPNAEGSKSMEKEVVQNVESKPVKMSVRKERLNITLDPEVKRMLEVAAATKHLSISALLTSLIVDNCQ